MWRSTLITVAFSLAFLVSAGLARAQTVDINQYTGEVAKQGGYDIDINKETALSQAVGRVIKVALSLVGLLFLALTIYAGILWMTAGGSEEQVEKAQKIFQTATLGLIVVLAGYSLTVFTLAAIGASAGAPNAAVGGGQVGPGPSSFWSSFGKNFKSNWWRYMF